MIHYESISAAYIHPELLLRRVDMPMLDLVVGMQQDGRSKKLLLDL